VSSPPVTIAHPDRRTGTPPRLGWRHLAGALWTLIRTDFKVRYHGTLGGFIWALLKPLSMFLVLMGVFSYVFTADPHYRINLILGLFLWEFFSEATKVGLTSLYAKGYLLTKTRFPRWIVVAASSSNALITLLVFVTSFLIYLGVVGRWPGGTALLLFALYQIEMWLIVLGFSLATSVIYLRYRDLNHLWDAASQAGFFVAPIVFPLEILPVGLHPYVYLWPPTPVIEFSRHVLIDGTIPTFAQNLYLIGVTLLVLTSGMLVFRRYAPDAAEHL